MSLQDDFEAAAANVKTLGTRPSNDVLLNLYALYKQGSVGDVTGKRPGRMAFKERAKYDAWAGKKGTRNEDAQQAYIDLVASLS